MSQRNGPPAAKPASASNFKSADRFTASHTSHKKRILPQPRTPDSGGYNSDIQSFAKSQLTSSASDQKLKQQHNSSSLALNEDYPVLKGSISNPDMRNVKLMSYASVTAAAKAAIPIPLPERRNVLPASVPPAPASKSMRLKDPAFPYLFESLKGAVDSMYDRCEKSRSVSLCNDVIYELREHISQFDELIKRITLEKQHNQMGNAGRPRNTSWAVPVRPVKSEKPSGFIPPPEDLMILSACSPSVSSSSSVSSLACGDISLETSQELLGETTTTGKLCLEKLDHPTVLSKENEKTNDNADTRSSGIADHLVGGLVNAFGSSDIEDALLVDDYLDSEDVIVKTPSGVDVDDSSDDSDDEAITERWSDHICRSPTRRNRLPKNLTPIRSDVRTPEEVKELQELRQAKAEEVRARLRNEKTEKLKEKSMRIQDISAEKEKEKATHQALLAERLEKVSKQREYYLQQKQEKAKEELEKSSRAVLVTALTAESKKVDIEIRHKESEARLLLQEAERRKRAEENAALQLKALERKKAIDEERVSEIKIQQEKRKETEQKLEEAKIQQHAERAAKKEEKARKVKEKQSEKEAGIQEKARTIQQRLERGTKRHEEHLELRKEKANAVNRLKAVPSPHPEIANAQSEHQPSETLTASLSPTSDDTDGDSNAVLVETEKQIREKMRKTRRRFRQLLALSARVYNIMPYKVGDKKLNSPYSTQLYTIIPKLLAVTDDILARRSVLFTEFERYCKDIFALKDSLESSDYILLRDTGCLSCLVSACTKSDAFDNSVFAMTSILEAVMILFMCINSSRDIVEYFATSSEMHVIALIDTLPKIIQKCTPTAEATLKVASFLLRIVSRMVATKDVNVNYNHMLRYVGISDVIGKIKAALFLVNIVMEDGTVLSVFVEHCMMFLASVTVFPHLKFWNEPVYSSRTPELTAHQLIQAFSKSDLAGITTIVDAILLYPGASSKAGSSIRLANCVVTTSEYAIRALNNFTCLHFEGFQNVLASKSLKTEMFHFLVFWLRYCQGEYASSATDVLLEELIVLIGHFALRNQENQDLLRFGSSPVILQLLLQLPVTYFSEKRLMNILFPTLIIACINNEQNRNILQNEVSLSYLTDYLSSAMKAVAVPEGVMSKLELDRDNFNARARFVNRFPRAIWQQALDYFTA